MKNDIFTPGTILSDARIAIEWEGFQCPTVDNDLPESEPVDPHELWCIRDVLGERVTLAAVSSTPVKDDGFLVLDPHRVIVDSGQWMCVMTQFIVARYKNELQAPGYIETPLCKVMSDSWAKLKPHFGVNPLTIDSFAVPDANWSAIRLIKSVLWDRWTGGCRDKPPVTVPRNLEKSGFA